MRKLVVLLAAAAALSTGACNTIGGMGEDVAAAGTAVACTAEEVQSGKQGC